LILIIQIDDKNIMHLIHLSIRDFRNIAHAELASAKGVNLFWGANAQGKTNLLEAIYYLITGRSFRTRQDRETLPWDSPSDTVAIIRGLVKRPESQYEIVVAMNRTQKNVSCNGKTLFSLGLLWGKMNAVLFTPGDLEIVQGSPGARRRFLDMEGCQMDHNYLYHLQRYAQILRQRNALLKSSMDDTDMAESLEVWDEEMASPAAEIYLFRRKFIKELAAAAGQIYNGIADSSESLDLGYESFLGKNETSANREVVEALFKEIMRRSRSEDMYRGNTNAGPHRDDFRITIGGQDARIYGSQGQQRSAMIALRLAEINLMKAYTGLTPILLLDDIVSELDEKRRLHFLSLLDPNLQTFITGTDADTLRGALPVEKTFQICNGRIL